MREVKIELADVGALAPVNGAAVDERTRYELHFANDAASPIAIKVGKSKLASYDPSRTPLWQTPLDPLFNATVTAVTSTTVSMDSGAPPPSGGGIEVRRSDAGWDADSDRALVGRFATQGITVPRLSRVQTYYLRAYDGSNPPVYSSHSVALHVDYPL